MLEKIFTFCKILLCLAITGGLVIGAIVLMETFLI